MPNQVCGCRSEGGIPGSVLHHDDPTLIAGGQGHSDVAMLYNYRSMATDWTTRASTPGGSAPVGHPGLSLIHI